MDLTGIGNYPKPFKINQPSSIMIILFYALTSLARFQSVLTTRVLSVMSLGYRTPPKCGGWTPKRKKEQQMKRGSINDD